MHTHTATNQLTLQPIYALPNLKTDTSPIPLDNCNTYHFYHLLLKDKQLQPSALNYWQTLPNCPAFKHTFWKNTYPSLNTNKQGALQLNDNIKRFGLTQTNNAIHNTDTLNLVNWTLTTARCTIARSEIQNSPGN